MKKLLTFGLCFAFYCAGAQEKQSKQDDIFIRDFSLRQSFQTPAKSNNPAILQVTLPTEAQNSWLIDAGLSFRLRMLSKGRLVSKITAEYHRNTIVDDKQNNYQFGYNFNIFKGLSDSTVTIPVTGNIKYIRDVTNNGHSAMGSLTFSLYRAGVGILCLGRYGYFDKTNYSYQLNPSFETQFQNILSSGSSQSGTILRPMLNVSCSIAKNRTVTPDDGTPPNKLIEISVDYVNRYAVVNSAKTGEGYTKLFRPRLNYYFVSNKNVAASLGASYNIGSDPLNGLKQQRFWLLSLQLQI